MRERLRSHFLRAIRTAGQYHEGARNQEEAQALYTRALEIDPLAEDLYRRLMLSLSGQGRRSEAIEVYRRCRSYFSIVLGTPPSAETDVIYRSLMGNP